MEIPDSVTKKNLYVEKCVLVNSELSLKKEGRGHRKILGPILIDCKDTVDLFLLAFFLKSRRRRSRPIVTAPISLHGAGFVQREKIVLQKFLKKICSVLPTCFHRFSV